MGTHYSFNPNSYITEESGALGAGLNVIKLLGAYNFYKIGPGEPGAP